VDETPCKLLKLPGFQQLHPDLHGPAAGAAPGIKFRVEMDSLNSYPQEKERKDWNGLHLMI